MQLLFTLALLFLAASAQTVGYKKYILWDDCNCNGTILRVEAYEEDASEYEDCQAEATTDGCEACNTLSPTEAPTDAPKRAIDLNDNVGETIECVTDYASLNVEGVSNTYGGYYSWDDNFCNGTVTYWEEYLIGTCYPTEGWFAVTCNDDGTGSYEYYDDADCTAANNTGSELYNSTDSCDGSNTQTSTCVIVTPAPTEAPTEATEAPTDLTPEPTSGSSAINIFAFKLLCKISETRQALEEVLSAAVTEGTAVTSECTISNCDATEEYDGAQFKYSCKGVDGGEFNETTAALICPTISAAIETNLGLASGITTCPEADQSGNPTGTKGLVVVSPLEAAGSFMTTSFFMLVALILAQLF
jgi:hypothetical protein